MTFSIFSPDGMAPDEGAVEQMENVMRDGRAVKGALMADHHKGYSMPIGGVVAYEDAVSPTGVGFDIGCGNKAVRTDLNLSDFNLDPDVTGRVGIGEARLRHDTFQPFMRIIQKQISFGLGRSSAERVDHKLFDHEIWKDISDAFGPDLRRKAQEQLGTVGSGNHYVDLLVGDDGQLWVANHFGSRGLGHTIASGFMAKAAGKDFTDRVPESEDAVVLETRVEGLGQFYIEAMNLAGAYAYAGRDYVADQVLKILGAKSTFWVHNHHNFAWLENGLWVVRKGATPLTRDPAFIGGSMGDISVIVRGTPNVEDNVRLGDKSVRAVEDIGNLGSAPHGAGRVMSRTKAAGKFRKMWICHNRNCESEGRTYGRGQKPEGAREGKYCANCGILLRKVRMRDTSDALIDWPSVRYDLSRQGITVLGAGADEAPGVYKNLPDVLAAHDNIEIMHTLRPLGVVMAGEDTRDPYKD